MANILNIRNTVSHGVLAVLLAGSACIAAPALAAESDTPIRLGPVQVQDKEEAKTYQAKESSSVKYTAPLRDVPQTITVITKDLIADQNLLNLRDILSNTVPGITFTAGEGGGGYGDGINFRGYSMTSDITIDGVRDSAQYTRSDPFNIEQIEVVNGANSVYSGGGAVAGGINLVTKVPQGVDNITLIVGGGTDSYGRATLDAERQLSDGVSLRLNLMAHTNDAPGRDVEKFSRYGIAPSLGVDIDANTRVTASYIYQHDDNIPQYGLPYFNNDYHSGMLPGVDRSNYYGFANMDRQRINTQAGTVIVTHNFSDDLNIRNLTRYSVVQQRAVLNPPQGTWCLADGTNASTGASCLTPGLYSPSGPRGTTRISENKTFYNQTDLNWSGEALGVTHNVVFGASFLSETFHLDTGNSQRTSTGTAPTYANMSISDPYNIYTGPAYYFQTGGQNGKRDNQAVYLFDTITLTPEFQLSAGIRYDHNKGKNNTETYTSGLYTSTSADFVNEEDLISYRVGAVYKPVEEASIYIAYGNSRTPSQSAVNGGCNENTCNVRPETAVNYEIGMKWDVLGDALSVQAALFRNERSNYKVPSGDPLLPDQVMDGSSRVNGLSLTVVGSPLPKLQIFGTYTYLDSKILQGASSFCLANPTLGTCPTDVTANTPVAGNPLTNTPEHAGNLWATYEVVDDLTLGYGLAVQGGYYFNNGSTTLREGGSYVTHRLMGTYDLTEQFALQVNVNNLFDVTYFTRGRNNGWATPGDARSITFTGTYKF